MAAETISINKNRENIYEFQAEIEGIEPRQVEFRLVIQDNGKQWMYKCLRKDDKNWFVSLPYDKNLTLPQYSFHIETIVDGYYFKALDGVIKIHEKDVGVTVTTGAGNTTTTVATPAEPEKTEEQPAEKPKVDKEKLAAILGKNRIVKPSDEEEKKEEPKAEPKAEEPKKDNAEELAAKIVKDEEEKEQKKAAEKKEEKPAEKEQKKTAPKKKASPKKEEDEEKSKKAQEALKEFKRQEEERKQRLAEEQRLREAEEAKIRKEEAEREWLAKREKERKIRAILNARK